MKSSDNTITDLRVEISKLRNVVRILQIENTELKNKLSQCKFSSRINGDSGFDSLEFISEIQASDRDSVSNGRISDEVDPRHNRRNQRPSSMYETREGIGKVQNWHSIKNQVYNLSRLCFLHYHILFVDETKRTC